MQCNQRLRHPKLRASMLVGAAKMVDLSTVNPSTWIAALSAVAAISSAIFAFQKFCPTARRALALSTATSQSANANFTLYLIDAFRYRPRRNQLYSVRLLCLDRKQINLTEFNSRRRTSHTIRQREIGEDGDISAQRKMGRIHADCRSRTS